MNIVSQAIALVVLAADKTPEPEDVKAGWVAFGLFVLLALAVVFLGFSLVKHLRRAERTFHPEDHDNGPESGPNHAS